MDIIFPENLPESKKKDYFNIKFNNYDILIKLIYELGSICTYEQFIKIYSKLNPNLSESYSNKKARTVIKDLITLKLIGSENINNYKYIYLKNFSLTIITGNYINNKRLNIKSSLKDKNFKISLIKVEYYIKHGIILKQDNFKNNLLNLTYQILTAKRSNPDLNANLYLLERIIEEKGATNYIEDINNLPDDDLIKIIWYNLYNIYYTLSIQGHSLSLSPVIQKLYKKGSKLSLSYAPEIILYDVHNKDYYLNKIKDLSIKFLSIPSNVSLDMRKSYQENSSLGWSGFNHFGYKLKILGFNNLELIEKRNFINSLNNDNPNEVIISNVEIENIDIEKYFIHASLKKHIFDSIDNSLDSLLNEKLNNNIVK